MSRIGLNRHGRGAEPQDDPLDGLVNLFDLGLVLAVAFLVAGLSIGGITRDQVAASTPRESAVPTSEQRVTIPDAGNRAAGQGSEVGTVYRLPDGTLVLDETATTP